MKIRSDSRTRPSQLQGAMTDISFNLIIFLLVAASFAANQGIFMRLPEEEESQPREVPPSQAVLVEISQNSGEYRVDGLALNEEDLAAGIGRAVDAKNPQVLVLEVDDSVPYGRVVSVLEKARAAGALAFSINGQGQARAVSLPGDGP